MPPASYSNIVVRATNWLGDAVMSLPALRAIRSTYPQAQITVIAKPWVADVYARESFADRIVPYAAASYRGKLRFALSLRRGGYDCAILLQNAFEAAAMAAIARIPEIIGYDRDGRGFLLTRPIATPKTGEVPEHERYYYLELLRRAGIIEELPETAIIELEGAAEARRAGRVLLSEKGIAGRAVGVSPGAAFGSAKQWLPERFAEAAGEVAARRDATVAVFGSAAERVLGDQVTALVLARGVACMNLAGQTTLAQFIDMAAACDLFLTNDSGAMHVAAALGVPVVAVFGATNAKATGPSGAGVRVVQERVECSPCLLRECPIDHRCMTAVTSARVVETALDLLK
jgi:heptosyltransferase-2